MEEFHIVKALLNMTLLGTEWVLWLLIVLSVLSVALMIERALFFYGSRMDLDEFYQKLNENLQNNDQQAALDLCEKTGTFEAQVALRGLQNSNKGASGMEEAMNGFIIGNRFRLDRGLMFLGTLGNNAPFVGLFGTVLGIIMAFNDLSLNPQGGPEAVMSGISEALVATAVGLMVAIPAVVAYNAFNRVVKRRVANAQAIQKLVITHHSHS